MLELKQQLPEFQTYFGRHLLPRPHLFHDILTEVLIDVDGAPEVAALLTPVDV